VCFYYISASRLPLFICMLYLCKTFQPLLGVENVIVDNINCIQQFILNNRKDDRTRPWPLQPIQRMPDHEESSKTTRFKNVDVQTSR
jgi:hypothetical protein